MEIKVVKSPLVLLTVIFAAILLTVVFLVWGFGISYKQNLQEFDLPEQKNTIKISKNETVKKITIKNNQDEGCIEVTPDGAVRVYKICGIELEKAARLTQNKHIADLYRLITETRLLDCPAVTSESILKLEIETETGKKIVCAQKFNKESGSLFNISQQLSNIAQIINNFLGDIPLQKASILPVSQIFSFPSVFPSPSSLPGASSYPTPVIIGNFSPSQNFSCDFSTETSYKKRPFNISNIICSTEPSPIPD